MKTLLSALNDSTIKVKDNYPKFDWVAMRNELKKTKTELVIYKKELNKTKNIIDNLSRTLNCQEIEIAVKDTELALIVNLLEKQKVGVLL